jgi:hypothetical protein
MLKMKRRMKVQLLGGCDAVETRCIASPCDGERRRPANGFVWTASCLAVTVGARCLFRLSLLSPDAGRRLTWIAPCKPQAQPGVWTATPYLNCGAVQLVAGLRRGGVSSTPGCPLHFVRGCAGLSMSDAIRRRAFSF